MGVGGNFWDLLKPYARYEGFDFLRDKKVAVDLSFWIVQQQTALKDAARNPHLRLTFFRTINLFSKFGAFPVFIVDGCPPPLKSETRILRSFRAIGVDVINSPGRNEISAERSQVFTKHVQECVELLEYLGMPVLKAKGEAEALCAQLNSEGYVDACITADSDAFLYGARCVIKYIRPNSREPFECYDMSDIEDGLHLKRKHLIAISLLVGSDLDLNGVQGIGLDTAVRFVQSVNDDEILNRLHGVGRDGVLAISDYGSVESHILTPDSGSMNRKSAHCSHCGHPGSKRLHLKVACEYCMINSADGCTKKPSGFKCYCTSCDTDRRKKDTEKQRRWWINVCSKISSGQNFPNDEIIKMYLNNDHGYFGVGDRPSISWERPQSEMVVDFLAYHQFWQPSFVRLRMVPFLSTIFLREMASNPTKSLLYGQFEFDGIKRVKIRFGHQLYLVKWRRVPCISSSSCNTNLLEDSSVGMVDFVEIDDSDESFDEALSFQVVDVGNESPFLLTDENMELVRSAFPGEVRRFVQAKELKERMKACSSGKQGMPESTGMQLCITEFYQSTKVTSPGKRKTTSSPSVSKSARRRICFE